MWPTVTDAQAERTEINRINGQEGVSLVLTKAAGCQRRHGRG